jgi:UDP-N-acetyl-D-glucosamine dehydrogenase
VAEHRLSLEVNRRESQLHASLVTFKMPGSVTRTGSVSAGSVAIAGLGYVGLPTAVELHGKSPRIIGGDVSERRLRGITSREAEMPTRSAWPSPAVPSSSPPTRPQQTREVAS